jgi:alkanesulfonate monooxygenase SsuD/methylene tetrahydromethanopterin reductase-like flavin-dependent oxidoreductase (luciferase family)
MCGFGEAADVSQGSSERIAEAHVGAVHLSEPSPQRTPFLFQAGTSAKGRDFAAAHAEGVFLGGPNRQVITPRVADLRERARRYGRKPDDILILLGVCIIADGTALTRQRPWWTGSREPSQAARLHAD